MSSEIAQESAHLLAMPTHILERILGWLDRVQDIILLSLASQAAHAAVAQVEWTGVHMLRLSHGAPSPTEAARIARQCPCLRELDATGCAQCLPESLQALAQLPFQVLRLSRCRALESRQGAAAVAAVLARGALRVLELCAGSDASILKGVLRQRGLERLSVSSCRWSESAIAGLSEIGTACPYLKHLHIEQCKMTMGKLSSEDEPKLKSLSLAGSKWVGPMGYVGYQLKELNVSGTDITDEELECITKLNLCPLLERLNISHCAELTDESINNLTMSDAVHEGRLWDLDISSMGLGFTGMYLRGMLGAWASAHGGRDVQHDLFSRRVRHVPALSLNVSCNLSIEPNDFVGFLYLFHGDLCSRIGHFRAQSCPRLSDPFHWESGTCHHSIFSAMAILGVPSRYATRSTSSPVYWWSHANWNTWEPALEACVTGKFRQLETLDLRDVFYASKQSTEANEAALASAIRGTAGRLKTLLVDNGLAGAEVAEAIASRGSCLEELSIPCCKGLSDAGLQTIAAACKQLQRLCVGGPSRAWSETGGLAAFSNLRELEICRRSLLTSGQLRQVLGQHRALEALKLSSCPRVTDEALEVLPAECLKNLTLVCCDGIQGRPLSRLKKLETLEFSSCNAVAEETIQVIAVSCRRLTRLALPKHIPRSCIPTQATGHLRGLQVLGGCAGPGTRANAAKHR